MLLKKEAIIRTLDRAPQSNKNAKKLLKIITDDWIKLSLTCAYVVAMWAVIIVPYYKASSKFCKFGDLIPVIAETRIKMQNLFESPDMFLEFKKFHDNRTHFEGDSERAFTCISLRWNSVDNETRDELQAFGKWGLARAIKKFDSDMELVGNCDVDLWLPMTNRYIDCIFLKMSK